MVAIYTVIRGIDTSTTGVYISDLHILLEVLKLPSQEHMYQIYMLLEVLKHTPQECMYLIYIYY